MKAERAFTVATLAERWDCSEGVIRKLIKDGELGCFRPGTLIRIPAEEVRRFESQNTPSSASEAATPVCGETTTASATAFGYTRPTGLERRRKLGAAGQGGTVQRGPWAGS